MLITLNLTPNPEENRSHFCVTADCEHININCRDCMFHESNQEAFDAWNKLPTELAGTTGTVFSEEVVSEDFADLVDKEVLESFTEINTQTRIKEICEEIKAMLIMKNKSYGDSATKPLRLFGKSTALEGLCTRIDDKLNRIYQGESFPGDNDVDDLIGYLILYKIVKEQEGV